MLDEEDLHTICYIADQLVKNHLVEALAEFIPVSEQELINEASALAFIEIEAMTREQVEEFLKIRETTIKQMQLAIEQHLKENRQDNGNQAES